MQIYLSECTPRGEKSIAIDDTILVRGMMATAGSRMLDGFYPLFDATATARLTEAGYAVGGKANVGEFGLDLLGETSYKGPALRADGTLVGAAALMVASGAAAGALNVDVNGAPRRAAALSSGALFIKPTYGTVSRHGVIPCACSAEQVGVTAPGAAALAQLLSVVAGWDALDGTSLPGARYRYAIGPSLDGLRVGVLSEPLERADGDMAQSTRDCAEALTEAGASVETVSFPWLGRAQIAWQVLMAAEACANLSRYDGIRFGRRAPHYDTLDALYVNSRTEGLGLMAKATILYGSDVLSKDRYKVCYDKALRARRLIREALSAAFERFDILVAPACQKSAYRAEPDNLQRTYDESYYTALASISGIPALAMRGVQLMADSLREDALFTAASCWERQVSANAL